MGKIKSVKINFLMNFILTASSFVFPLITFPYVSRILMAEGMGKVAFATSVVNYFSMVASLGIPTYGIRACARVRDDKKELSKIVQELIIIHTITTLISLSCLLFSIMIIDKFSAERTLFLINAFMLILNVLGVSWLYSALEQYTYITVRSIIFKIISVIFMFAFIKQKNDYVIYGAISIFASAGSNILNFIRLKKFVIMKPFGKYNFKRHLKPIIVFFAQSVAITIYTNLDTTMIGFIKNDYEVGLYDAAIKVKTIMVSLVTSLGTVLLPRLSYYVVNDMKKQFTLMIDKALEFVLALAIPITIFLIIFSKDCILLLSGKGYLEAIPAMQIISPCILFIGLSNITGIQVLTPMGHEKLVLHSVIIGAVIDLILNAILIPYLGFIGAAIGTVFAEISVFIYQYKYLRKEIINFNIIKKLKSISIAVLMAILFIMIFKNISLNNIFVILTLNGIVFFGVYVFMLYILKEQIVYGFVNELLVKLCKHKN